MGNLVETRSVAREETQPGACAEPRPRAGAASLSDEYLAHIGQMGQFCTFLARLYYEELDDALLDDLARTQQVLPLSDDLDEMEREFVLGNNRIAKYVQNRTPDTLVESKCDYARVFLGAGQLQEMPVAPFESVYTSEDRILMQDARDDMYRTLRRANLVIDDRFNMPEDHIAFELQYLAWEAGETCRLAEEGDWERAAASSARFEDFLRRHLLNWVPRFVDEALELACTPFYRGLLQMTKAWLLIEASLLEDGERS